jgi:biopolymer transport protein TolR
MAMSMGGSGGRVAQINVTPMIDILLVLLIIFMVIVPVAPRGLSAFLPQPPRANAQRGPDNPIVIQVTDHPGASLLYRINGTAVPHSEILEKLTEIYLNRADRVLFVEGDDQVRFADVADLIDIGRAANVDRVALMTPRSRLLQ